MKYRVDFSGFAYVEADSQSEALDKYENSDTVYEESEASHPVEVDEFTVDL